MTGHYLSSTPRRHSVSFRWEPAPKATGQLSVGLRCVCPHTNADNQAEFLRALKYRFAPAPHPLLPVIPLRTPLTRERRKINKTSIPFWRIYSNSRDGVFCRHRTNAYSLLMYSFSQAIQYCLVPISLHRKTKCIFRRHTGNLYEKLSLDNVTHRA